MDSFGGGLVYVDMCLLKIKQRGIQVYREGVEGVERSRRLYIFWVYCVLGSVLNVLDGLLNLIIIVFF